MVRQGFHIGERDWWVMCYYDIRNPKDFDEVEEALLSVGKEMGDVEKDLFELSGWNAGMTLTDFDGHYSLVFIGKATSPEEMYDTIQHELKHLTEHIGEYYGLDPKGEKSAYLQGELGRQMFPAAAIVICPNCRHSAE